MSRAIARAEPTPRRAVETRARSLQDEAYEAIKRLIITLRLKPAEVVNEQQLSARIGMGRTPVHLAIRRLAVESLVDILPRKGVIVRPLSVDEMTQLADVRMINEVFCARLAAERISDTEIAKIAKLLAGVPRLIRQRDIARLMDVDVAFHNLIARASRNDVLAGLLASLHQRQLRFWFVSLNRNDQIERVQEEHTAILQALKTRNPAAAARAMEAHITAFKDNVARA